MLKKIFLLVVCAFMLCGCTDPGPENAVNKPLSKLEYSCINGHLYIRSFVSGGYTYTPLFAEGSDTPVLVRCDSLKERL